MFIARRPLVENTLANDFPDSPEHVIATIQTLTASSIGGFARSGKEVR